MRSRTPEEHTVGHDDAAFPAYRQELDHPLDEEQFGLLRLEGQGIVDVALVDAPLEGRVGKDNGIALLFIVAFGEGVLEFDAGGLDAVEHQVHERYPGHRGVKVEPVEGIVPEFFPVFLVGDVVADEVAVLALAIDLQEVGACVLPDDVLVGVDEEAGRAARRVADPVSDIGVDQFHDHPDDVARGAELSVLPGGGELGEEILVDVALGVAVLGGDIHIIDDGDRFLEEGGFRDDEDGVLHLPGKERLLPVVERLDEGEDHVPDMLKHLLGGVVLPGRPPALLVVLEDRGIRHPPQPCTFLLDDIHVLKPLHEDEVGHLLDGLERV